MAGVKGEQLSAADAQEFRQCLRGQWAKRQLTVPRIVAAGDQERSDRWFYRAMTDTEPLRRSVAVELADKMRVLGARLPAAVIRKLQKPGPVLIVPKGGAKAAAAEFVQSLELSKAAARDALPKAEAFFRRYERFVDTPLGADIMERVKTALGGEPNWRGAFAQALRARPIDPDAYVVKPEHYALTELEQNAALVEIVDRLTIADGDVALTIAQEQQHPRKRRKASK